MRLATPYIFLALTLLAVLSLSYVAPQIERNQILVNEARTSYIDAVSKTRLQLVALVRETAENPTLQENIKWDLQHSVNKTLEGDLIESQLDSLMLVDGKCQVVAASSLNSSPQPACNGQNLAAAKLFWQENTNFAPSLNFTFQIPSSEKTFYLIGSVFLDTSRWMAIYPELYRLKSALNLEIKSTSAAKDSTIIVSEGSTENSQANLVTDGLLSGWSSSSDSNPWTKVNYLILIGLLTIGYLWWNNKNESDKIQLTLQNFVFWAKKFARVNESNKEGALQQTATTSPLEYAKLTLEKFHNEYKVRLQRSSEEILSLHSEIRQLRSEANLQEEKLSATVPLESLAIQIAEGRERFKNETSQLMRKIEKIINGCTQGISRNTGSSKAILNRWQKEMKLRGARRFFRAMSEQTVDTGESLLEQQFAMLYKSTTFADEQSTNVSKQVQAVNENLRSIFRQTSYWCDVASKGDLEVEPDYSLIDACLTAQQMIVKSSGLAPIFENQLDFEQDPLLSRVPKNIWTSITFHIYDMYLDLNGDRTDVKIRTWQKTDGTKKLIIISMPLDLGSNVEIKNIQSKDFDLARKLCQQFNLNCEKLPDLSGTMAIAITSNEVKDSDLNHIKKIEPVENSNPDSIF